MKRIQEILAKADNDAFLSASVMGMRGTSLVTKFVFTLFIAHFMGFKVLGSYGLISSASIIASLFFGLTLIHTISRDAVMQTKQEICRNILYYAYYIFLTYSCLFVLTLLAGLLFEQPVLFFLILLVVLLEHINGDFYRLFLNLSQPFTANLLHFIRTAGWMIIFMILAILIPEIRTLHTLLISWILGGLITTLITISFMRDWPWQPFSFDMPLYKWVLNEFSEARNMHITSVLMALSQYWNHFLISLFLGLELTGVYVFFMQVMSALTNLVSTGVIQISRPKLVRAYKEKNTNYMNIFFKSLKDTLIISVLMALFTWPCLYFATIYLDKPLALQWFTIFPYILILFIITMINEVMKLIFYSHYRDDIILKLSIIMITFSIVLNTGLVMLMSLWGAVISQIIVHVIVLFLQLVFIKSLVTDTLQNNEN